MLEGFKRSEIKTSGARIVTVTGGKGPPLLLMHGNPFNHLSWQKIAPRLAHRVHGGGDRPARLWRFREAAGRRQDHINYSFRAMAQDQVEVMAALGFDRFYAAGPRPRRARAAPHVPRPSRRRSRARPSSTSFRSTISTTTSRKAWATFSWHWFFNIQPYDLPERMMGADPDWFIKKKLAKTEQGLSFFDPAALADFMRCFRNPATIHAICEDYRAGAAIDLEMDEADFKAGRKIDCPVLLLWGATGGVGRNHKSMEIWPRYAADIRAGKALPSGHYVNEEAPEETYSELRAFFRDGELK